jgi:predicted alpha/beta-hydrolase family hydrolase
MKVRVDEKRAVTVAIDAPAGGIPGDPTVVVLAHGAGNDMGSAFLIEFAEAIREAGHVAVRFNFPYKEEGKKAPNPQPLLMATYRAVLDAVREKTGAARPFIGGKSMGSRMATYLAAEGDEIAGLVLLGYPLHPAGRPDRIRNAHFPDIRVPTLFLEGDRDSLCDLALLRESLETFGGDATLHVLPDGDHSFKVRKKSGRTNEETMAEAKGALLRWLAGRAAL